VKVQRIHGNRSQSQRTEALAGFKSGRYQVLVATDIAARGIDVTALGHVINFDVPGQAEDYIHRVGRTGRAGGSGVASTLFVKDQRTELFQLERALGIKIERIRPDGLPHQAKEPVGIHNSRPSSIPKSNRITLPGEVLQMQLEG
jgi:ATP-dependent RNA helicase RhlE